ncbi:MAG: putative chaperone protein, partial [Moritella sp.]
ELVDLGQQSPYLASTLYASHRNMIASWVAANLPDTAAKQDYLQLRRGAIQASRNLVLDGYEAELVFGQAALDTYLEEPEEGYYIKSPKSFLGATSLSQPQLTLMEDVVTAMICNIKNNAEAQLDKQITQVVMGKPVNFQGLRGAESNQQALTLLTTAAQRAGFKQVEFLYEPLAAGFDYEQSLDAEKTVLVVDIGGGTTDCSLLKMGPEHCGISDRFEHVLGYSGERIGGNDFDIHFAQKALMPLFGLNSQLENGLPMPVKPFWDAVAINDIGCQTHFYSQRNLTSLQDLHKSAEQKELLVRLVKLQQQKQTYQVVNLAEQMKKQLSQQVETTAKLDFIETGLTQQLQRHELEQANTNQLTKIKALIDETMIQAQTTPQVIFVTGGTAKSPIIYQFLQQNYPSCEIIIGDHFGSVTKGLTRWAEQLFT